jgi:long-chain fatty acid transport protein
VGIGITPLPALTFGADFQRILYSDVNAVGNASLSSSPLGSDGGPGFAWADISVIKAGAQYAVSKVVTIRGGYNHSDNPVTSPDVTMNILAPGVIQITSRSERRAPAGRSALDRRTQVVGPASAESLTGGGRVRRLASR